MKKLGLIFMLGCIAFFGSCSDDNKDEPKPEAKDYAKEIQGRYAGAVDDNGNGGLHVTLAGSTVKSDDAINIVRTANNKVTLELKDFKYTDLAIGDITLANLDVDGNDQVVNITSKEPIKQTVLGGIDAYVTIKSAKVTGKKVAIELTIDVKEVGEVGVTFDGEFTDKSGEAKLLEVKATHALLDGDAVFDADEKTINLYLIGDAKLEDFKDVIFTLKTSDKASSDPKSGDKVDLTTGTGTITITAQDGVMKTVYSIHCTTRSALIYDMETWVKGEGSFIKTYIPAGGWGSSNPGVSFIKSMTNGIATNVDRVEEANHGTYAAKLTTLDSTGGEMLGQMVPKVTSGTLFHGKFDLGAAMSNKLTATKFGIPFTQKPVKLKVSYKYTPGKEFLRSSVEKPKEFVVEANTEDKGSINAILYEIETEKDAFLDGTNAYTSDKLVATAKLDAKKQDKYADVEVKFEYKKAYDKSKKYRFAIITSSSKEGDTYSGAPGSTLWIDHIEVIAE